jgi:hypothetical protein
MTFLLAPKNLIVQKKLKQHLLVRVAEQGS